MQHLLPLALAIALGCGPISLQPKPRPTPWYSRTLEIDTGRAIIWIHSSSGRGDGPALRSAQGLAAGRCGLYVVSPPDDTLIAVSSTTVGDRKLASPPLSGATSLESVSALAAAAPGRYTCGVVYALVGRRGIVAVDLDTRGRTRLRDPAGGPFAPSLTFDPLRRVLYLASADAVLRYDPADESTEVLADGDTGFGPAVDGLVGMALDAPRDRLLALGPGGGLLAIDLATGDRIELRVDEPLPRSPHLAVADDGTLAVATDDVLLTVQPASGAVVEVAADYLKGEARGIVFKENQRFFVLDGD